MDPDEVLQAMRELVSMYREDDVADPLAHTEALVDTFESLDGWISGGGFLPEEWAEMSVNG